MNERHDGRPTDGSDWNPNWTYRTRQDDPGRQSRIDSYSLVEIQSGEQDSRKVGRAMLFLHHLTRLVKVIARRSD